MSKSKIFYPRKKKKAFPSTTIFLFNPNQSQDELLLSIIITGIRITIEATLWNDWQPKRRDKTRHQLEEYCMFMMGKAFSRPDKFNIYWTIGEGNILYSQMEEKSPVYKYVLENHGSKDFVKYLVENLPYRQFPDLITLLEKRIYLLPGRRGTVRGAVNKEEQKDYYWQSP